MFFTDKKWKFREEKRKIYAQQKFEKEFAIETRKAYEREKENEIRALKKKHTYVSDQNKKITTTKILMYLILANCTVIEIYSMWVMYHFADLSALYSLIGAVIGESLSFAIYCFKSFNETKEEELLKLQRDKFLYETNQTNKHNEEDIEEDDIPDEES